MHVTAPSFQLFYLIIKVSLCQRLNQLQVKKNVKPEVSLNQKDFLKHKIM